jgi:hypothetical protein
MSVEKIAAVLHHAPIGGTAKLLLIGIANHEGDGGAWPAMATLARYAGVTDRNARKMMKRLIELGFVEAASRDGQTNVYRTCIECPPDCDRSTNHRMTPVATVTPVAFDTPTPVATDRGGMSLATAEPSMNHNINLTETSFSVEAIFDTFIDRYPRPSDRRNAWASFSKLTIPEALQALDALERWMTSVEYPAERKYVPYAANWIDRGYHRNTYTAKKAETGISERINKINQKKIDETPAEIAESVIECEHGTTAFCRECYTQKVKEK